MKSPITSKAARSVEQYQTEVDDLRERARRVRTAITTNKSALFSNKSALLAAYTAGLYLGARPRQIKVTDPTAAYKKSFSPLSLISTALSLMTLRRKVQLLTSRPEGTKTAEASASQTEHQ